MLSNVKSENKLLPQNFEPTIELINKGMRVMVILRGLPGKSDL